MAERKKVRLGDIAKINQEYYSPKEKWEYVNYLDTGNITMNSIDSIQYIDLSAEKIPSRAKRKVRKNSIIYSTVRPNQLHYGIIKEQPDNFLVSTGFVVIDVDCNMANADYIYYILTQREITEHLQAIGEQSVSAYPSIKPSDVEDLEVNLPSIKDQQKIVSILSAIDEKIRNNCAINNNLEQQALTLFREYFMDCVPYGGCVPSDWNDVSLDDVCTRITDGSHYSPADAPGSPYPMYSVKDMEAYGFNPSSCKHITEEEFHKMKKNDCVPLFNDILVAKDGSYLKEIFICSEEREEAILSSIAIFRPNTNIIIPEILLYLLKQPSVRRDVGDNYVSGSALPRIVLKDFKKYRFMLPPMAEQIKIGSVLHAIRMQIKANTDEIRSLSALSDTLLPRLMSGELDVSSLDC